MKIAIPYWQNIISPVFDAAATVVIVDVDRGVELGREKKYAASGDPLLRAGQLAGLGVDLLICGAISGRLESLLAASGVKIISNIRGDIDDVLNAFLQGTLTGGQFFMPGCRGQRRRRRGRQRG